MSTPWHHFMGLTLHRPRWGGGVLVIVLTVLAGLTAQWGYAHGHWSQAQAWNAVGAVGLGSLLGTCGVTLQGDTFFRGALLLFLAWGAWSSLVWVMFHHPFPLIVA